VKTKSSATSTPISILGFGGIDARTKTRYVVKDTIDSEPSDHGDKSKPSGSDKEKNVFYRVSMPKWLITSHDQSLQVNQLYNLGSTSEFSSPYRQAQLRQTHLKRNSRMKCF